MDRNSLTQVSITTNAHQSSISGGRWFSYNRDGGIRTRDPLNPIQVRYRTALRPGNPNKLRTPSGRGATP